MIKPCVQQANPVSYSSMAGRTQEKRERNEAEIIRRAQSGDAEAFEHLYRLHSRRVYALCIRMTANSSLAEDLTQEAFLQVFRKIRSFRGNSAFSTWLHRVTFNTVLMHCRKKRVTQMSLETAISGVEDSQPTAQIGADDASVSSSLDRVMLNKAVRRLPRGYKRVLLLHDVLGYEHHEIAKALGCAHGTSKSQLTKARRYLRRLLQGGLGKLTERVHESA